MDRREQVDTRGTAMVPPSILLLPMHHLNSDDAQAQRFFSPRSPTRCRTPLPIFYADRRQGSRRGRGDNISCGIQSPALSPASSNWWTLRVRAAMSTMLGAQY
mmetsp:Transcript_10188/g.20514  ORF Transcript_10188/g.20514 Transcript_10188/m.20514 type:complete len:103 (+) Transcript_10188:184-492(+)